MVLLIALVLWLIGAAMGAPHRARWVMIASLPCRRGIRCAMQRGVMSGFG